MARRPATRKVATFNVNSINRRLPNLLAWLKSAKPDIVCLQELKATDEMFPEAALQDAGYEAVWCGQKSWNGVAILARGTKPNVTRAALPGAPDEQARYIEAAVDGILVAAIYAPNGNPQPGPKFDYKLDWMTALARHTARLKRQKLPVILVGDFNVVLTDFDIYPTTSWDNDALLQPESRKALAKILAQGWTDAVRSRHPKKPMYSYWDYMRRAWERDAGLRIDYLLVSEKLAPKLINAGVDRAERGKPSASDHAPVWITLKR